MEISPIDINVYAIMMPIGMLLVCMAGAILYFTAIGDLEPSAIALALLFLIAGLLLIIMPLMLTFLVNKCRMFIICNMSMEIESLARIAFSFVWRPQWLIL